jgi:hypothetical protein
MTQEHPITPPPELVKKWIEDWAGAQMNEVPCGESMEIATQAARWGADQELEACCEWLISNQNPRWAAALQEGRRPKPKSEKQQALEQLDGILAVFRMSHGGELVCDAILRALKSIPDPS